MNNLNEFMKDTEAGLEDLKELTEMIVSKIRRAHERSPEQACTLLKTIAYLTGMQVPTLVEERSYALMHTELIEAMGEGIQIGMKKVDSKASMEMVVRRF
jgi:hypothetical protein